MGLTQALATSLSGLTATQTGLSIVAGNVANADTPGYVRKTSSRSPSAAATPASACASARSSASSTNMCRDNCGSKIPAPPTPTCARSSTAGCRVSTAIPARQLARVGLQQLHQCVAGAVGEPGRQRGAQRRSSARRSSSRKVSTPSATASRRCAATPSSASPTRSARPTRRCQQIAKLNQQLAALGDDSTADRGACWTSATTTSTSCRS